VAINPARGNFDLEQGLYAILQKAGLPTRGPFKRPGRRNRSYFKVEGKSRTAPLFTVTWVGHPGQAPLDEAAAAMLEAGMVVMASPVGEFNTFRVEWPLHRKNPRKKTASRKKKPALDFTTSGDARRVLRDLVKDDPELAARLVNILEVPAGDPVRTPELAFAELYPLVAGLDQEALVVLALDRRRRTVGRAVVTLGNDGFTVVDPKQIMRWALGRGRSGAAAIIMGHNHPSSDPMPSQADKEVTHRVAAAGRIMGVPVLDHLVMADTREGRGTFVSLAERGELPYWEDRGPPVNM